jgi:hypothetical protein
MHCQRCSQEFPDAELMPPSTILRVLALPFFAMFLLRSRAVGGELTALYCRPCRRQLNFCIFFAAFLVVTMGTLMLLLQLGIVEPRPVQPPR